MKQRVYERLVAELDEKRVFLSEPMKKHTTFRIGGPADYFVTPKSGEEVERAVAICKEEKVPYYIVVTGGQ